MSVEEVMTNYRQAIQKAVKGNIDALDEVFAPDVRVHEPPNGEFEGLNLLKNLWKAMHESFSDMHWEWKEWIIKGNTAAARYVLTFKHTGKSTIFPWPVTGKEVALSGCGFYHIKDDKIIELFIHEDLLGCFQQMGLIPPINEIGR